MTLSEAPKEDTPPASIDLVRSDFLTSEQVKEWRYPNLVRLVFDFSLIWLQAVVPLAIFFIFPNWFTFLLAFILVAGAQHGLFLAAHEFAHYLVLPNNRKLNDRIGNYLFSLPVVLPLELFRHRHFIHHRTYSTDEDTKTVYRHDIRGWKLLKELIRSLSGYEFIYHVLEVEKQDRIHAERGQPAPSRASLLPGLFLVQGTIFLIFCLAHPTYYFVLWLLPLVTLTEFFGKIRAIMEHQPPFSLAASREERQRGDYFRGTTRPFVRTVDSNFFEGLFFSKINFCYHAEHHLWPQISYQNLPKVRECCDQGEAFKNDFLGRENSYLSTIGRLWCEPEEQSNRDNNMRRPETNPYNRKPESNIAKIDVKLCPVCGSAARSSMFTVKEHEYHTTTDDQFFLQQCKDCTAWFLDPRPDEKALSIIYPPNYYIYSSEQHVQPSNKQKTLMTSLMSWLFKRRIAPVARYLDFNDSFRWLDVGCGHGLVLQDMKDAFGVSGVGIDFSAKAVALAQGRGFEAHKCRFEDFEVSSQEPFDLIHSSHVIEHVVSPFDYMKKAYELLRPGGINAVITPNTDTWESTFFGTHWGGLHVPRHWALLNRKSARILGEKTGFELVEIAFSTNGTFWTWTFHSLLQNRIPESVNDSIFPSDHRFIIPSFYNIARIGVFTGFDILNKLFTGRSSNMLLVYRKV